LEGVQATASLVFFVVGEGFRGIWAKKLAIAPAASLPAFLVRRVERRG
jgi:hypothetical protein